MEKTISYISDETYYLFGTLLLLINLASIIINGTILFLFIAFQQLRTRQYMLMTSLSGCFLAISVIGMPMIISSSYVRNWLFGDAGCIFFAFMMLFLGLSSICILTLIVFDRYFTVLKGTLSLRTLHLGLFFCFLYSLIWSLSPIWGWGSFSPTSINITCFLNWKSQKGSDFSYLIILLVLTWILPLAMMTYFYTKILLTVKKKSTASNLLPFTWKMEKNFTLTVLFLTMTMVLSWSPYCMEGLWYLVDPDTVPVALIMVSELSMKLSMLWLPLIYLKREKAINTIIKKYFLNFCNHRATTTVEPDKETKEPIENPPRNVQWTSPVTLADELNMATDIN